MKNTYTTKHFDETSDRDLLHVYTVQECDQILADNALLREWNEERPRNHIWKHAARVPTSLYYQWLIECGAPDGSPEHTSYMESKLRDPDWNKLIIAGW